MLKKPAKISSDEFKSQKWDEIVANRSFSESDVAALTLLCQWYAVVERCMSDLDFGGDLPQVAYQNDSGDLKAMPQLSTMKQASAEIRALNKQLGINDEVQSDEPKRKETTLYVIQNRRRARGKVANG